MKRSSSVTRQDVARRARTSVAVVSYVINDGPRNVKPETRERVLAAVRELGYRANAAARTLRTRRTMAIGLVVPDASSPFFGALAREIEDAAFARGYTLLLGNAMDDKAREAAYVRTLLGRQVDGLIMAPCPGENSWIDDVGRSSTASVIVDRELDDVPFANMTVDNERAAHAAVRHLVTHRRQRIGCVAGPKGAHPTDDRVRGWRRALVEAGLEEAAGPVSYGTFRQRDGHRAGFAMLSGTAPPDAIFATSDEQAIGVLSAAHRLGLRVPEDLAVFGFDGMESAAFSIPPLSTVEQPLRRLARGAVDRVIGEAVGQQPGSERVELSTRLTLRRSCGCEWDEAKGMEEHMLSPGSASGVDAASG